MQTRFREYETAFIRIQNKNCRLKAENAQLGEKMESVNKVNLNKKLAENRLRCNYAAVVKMLNKIPPEVRAKYLRQPPTLRREYEIKESSAISELTHI